MKPLNIHYNPIISKMWPNKIKTAQLNLIKKKKKTAQLKMSNNEINYSQHLQEALNQTIAVLLHFIRQDLLLRNFISCRL